MFVVLEQRQVAQLLAPITQKNTLHETDRHHGKFRHITKEIRVKTWTSLTEIS